MASHKFSLLFFGSDVFSVRVLSCILDNKSWPVQVVTKPNTLLYQFSKKNNICHHQWTPGIKTVDPKTFNMGLVASFGAMIDIETILKFEHGLFNVHPSLLPSFRGSTPVQAAILTGLAETGCTIMKIPPIQKFDIGDIVLQEKLLVRKNEYARDLMLRLADLGGRMTIRFLLNYDSLAKNTTSQSEAKKSYAKKLKPEMGLLQFRAESSIMIDRKVRAYTDFIQLYTSCLCGLICRLEYMRDPENVAKYNLDELAEADGHVEAGKMFFHKKRKTLCIKCFDGKWLAFDRITPKNRHAINSLDFYNGYLSKIVPYKRMTDV